MKTLLGMAVVAAALALSGPAAIAATDKAPQVKSLAAVKSDATDFSARRFHRRYDSYGRYYRPAPYNYARPYYYRPYPYALPAPFPFGLGYGPLW